MNRVIDNSKVPPGGTWTYVHAENGYVQQHPYLHQLRQNVKKYRQINNFPVGSEFNAEFEDNVCKRSAYGVCADFIPPSMMEKASSLTKALTRWAMSGFKVRKEDEVERIRAICKYCTFYGGENGLLKVICKKCGCSNLKLWVQDSHCPINKW